MLGKNPSPQRESNPRIGKGDGDKNDAHICSKKTQFTLRLRSHLVPEYWYLL